MIGNDAMVTRLTAGVLTVDMSMPPINMIGPEFVTGLIDILDHVESADDVRVVIFESSDADFFLPHVDMTRIPEYTAAAARSGGPDDRYLGTLFRRLSTTKPITIAKVRGRAGGAGSEFILACDMAFAAVGRATFGHPEAPLGTYPGAGALQHLARRAGRARTMEILLGGSDFTAEEAAAYNWVNRAVPDTELDTVVAGMARRIADSPEGSVRLVKRRINAATLPPMEDVYVDASSFQSLSSSPELKSRVSALFASGMQQRGPVEFGFADAVAALGSGPTGSPEHGPETGNAS